MSSGDRSRLREGQVVVGLLDHDHDPTPSDDPAAADHDTGVPEWSPEPVVSGAREHARRRPHGGARNTPSPRPSAALTPVPNRGPAGPAGAQVDRGQ
jgi:hypothetical protein